MHISSLTARGYRNLQGTVGVPHPLAVLVGENNSGKSNVIDALRLVLEPENPARGRYWARKEDFAHDGRGSRVSDEFELEVRLEGLDAAEQTRMVTCLVPDDGTGVAKLRMRAKIGRDGRVRSDWYGGNSEQPDVERHAREAVRFVYLHPLRDAAADLRPGRDNRLIPLIKALIPEDHEDYGRVVDAMRSANDALDTIGKIGEARGNVHRRLTGMTGGGRFARHSTLAFEDPEFERIVGQLRAKIGELAPLELAENGLGYNNILYMAVLLATMVERPDEEDPTLRVLLVEEPEAHLHPQLQDLLMRFLEAEAGTGNQVIVTSHSPNFVSAAKVERLSVMSSLPRDDGLQAHLPRDFEMERARLSYLHRFLDVTKAALFFANGVILVEGVAEQLLVPVFARLIGSELAPAGVTVINIGGVAFAPFADLFGEGRLPGRLAAISDADPRADPDDPDGGHVISPRARKLKESAGGNVGVFLSTRTLEWDLARIPENREPMIGALTQLKPVVGPRTATEIADHSDEDAATALADAIGEQKGEYAQIVAELIAVPDQAFSVPDYIRDAILWVAAQPSPTDPQEDAASAEAAAPSSGEAADDPGEATSAG
jgi:putative ATP-dependent endonuclease of OLD family